MRTSAATVSPAAVPIAAAPTLDDVALLVSRLQSLAMPEDHASALATLRKAARQS
jgi:hypothetical protein